MSHKETEIFLREVIKNQDNIDSKVITAIVPENEPCKCIQKITFSACPDWLGQPDCSICNKPTIPSKFFVSGATVLVQINNEEPKPICDDCRSKLNKDCKHIFKLIEKIIPEEEGIKWKGKLEFSFNGEKWYFVSGNNVIPYLPYVVDKAHLNKLFAGLVEKLHEGNPLSIKGEYSQSTQSLSINVSSYK